MTEKSEVFNNRSEWEKAYGKSTQYHKYSVYVPTSYPCIGIEEIHAVGDLGVTTSVQVYVYLADFVKSP